MISSGAPLALPLIRLRRLITLVPQNPGLFGETMRDALAGPKDILSARQDEQGTSKGQMPLG